MNDKIWLLWECAYDVDDEDMNRLLSIHRTENGAYAARDAIIAEDDDLTINGFVVNCDELCD